MKRQRYQGQICIHLSSYHYNISLSLADYAQTHYDLSHFRNTFKGVLHLPPQKAPKLTCFVLYLYLKIINIFLKNDVSYSKLSKVKELKNSIKIQAVLELLVQNQHFDCFLMYSIT